MQEKTAALEDDNKQMKEMNATLRQELDWLKEQQKGALAPSQTTVEQLEEQSAPLVNRTVVNSIDADTLDETFEDTANNDNDGFSNLKWDDKECDEDNDDYDHRDRGITIDDDENVSLLEDTFSFLISAKVGSVPFLTGSFVFLLKNTIFILVVMNLIDTTKVFNKLNIPVTVEFSVMVSQLLAFMISVFTQNDLVSALIQLFQGYDDSIKEAYGRNGRGGGNKAQWLFSLSCALVDGLFGLAVTFLLIVTSGTVLDVLLNFAAVKFVAGLDEAAFFLAQMGFAGPKNKAEAKVVMETTYKSARLQRHKKNRADHIQTAGLMVVFFIVMSFWITLEVHQQGGKYCAKKIIAQFDDQIRPVLGAHSGFYSLQTKPSWHPADRFQYTEDRAGGGRFAYCQSRREWRFVVGDGDHCDDAFALAKSIETRSMDLLDVAPEMWFVKHTQSDHFLPMPDFFMDIGCERDADCGGTSAGECRSNVCECENDRFGFRCEYSQNEVCSDIQLDARFELSFPSVRLLPTSYTAVGNKATAYERPIFFNNDTNDVILFTGVRWAITSLTGIIPTNTTKDKTLTQSLLQNLDADKTFFAGDITSIDMMSLPLPYQSFDDRWSTPIAIEWEIIPIPGSLDVIELVPTSNPVQMLCSVCNNDNNLCSFDNTCSNGQCVCDDRSAGALCQLPPIGDGYCDPKFNAPKFGYDGGDCCSATCVGSQCGLPKVGSIPMVRIGFPYCKDPSILAKATDPSLSLYIRNSQPIEALSSEGTMVPTLSANGVILVVGEPDIGAVRVFDLVASDWVQRGRTLQGTQRSGFGYIAAIATSEASVVSSPTGLVPVTLAIGEPKTAKIRTFRWPRDATDWLTEPTISVEAHIGGAASRSLLPGARLLLSYWYGIPLVGQVEKNVTVLVDNGYGGDGSMPFGNTICMYTRRVTPSPTKEFFGGCNYFRPHASISTDGNRIIQVDDYDIDANGTVTIDLSLPPSASSLHESFGSFTTYDPIGVLTYAGFSASYNDFKPPDTTVVHLADASTPITDHLRPVLRGRGYTMVLESSSVKNTTSVILLYRPDIKAGDNSSRLNTGEQNVERTLLLDKNITLSGTVSSRDGTAVTLSFSNGTASTFALGTDRTRWMEISMKGVLYDDSPFSEFGSALSISDGARHLAASTPGVVQTYSANQPTCDPDEVAVRLAINFNGSPELVSWDIFVQADEGRPVTLASCNECYTWLRNLYSWNAIATDICVPRVNIGCVGLTMKAGFNQHINGFAAFVMDRGNVTLAASDSGTAVDGSKIYSFENVPAGGGCGSTGFPS